MWAFKPFTSVPTNLSAAKVAADDVNITTTSNLWLPLPLLRGPGSPISGAKGLSTASEVSCSTVLAFLTVRR
jgi:hypothetical protein